MRLFLKSLFLLSLVALVGCTQVKKDLPLAIKKSSKATDLFLVNNQQELGIEVNTVHTGGQFGLIGMLIEAEVNKSKAKKANKVITDLRNAMIDIDVDKKYKSALVKELRKIKWMDVKNVSLYNETDATESLNKGIAESKAELALSSAMVYELSSDHNNLNVKVHVNIFPLNEELKSFIEKPDSKSVSSVKNSIYRNFVSVQIPLADSAKDREHALAIWAKNEAQKVKSGLDLAFKIAAETLIFDINKNSEADKDKDLEKIKYKKQHGMFEYGYILNKSDENRYLIRAKDGTLFSKVNLLK